MGEASWIIEDSCHCINLFLTFLFAVPPQGAKIYAPFQPMTADRKYAISCEVWGSNPPARIEWYRGRERQLHPLKTFNQTVTQGGNVTVSFLEYVPRAEHHHDQLTCRGTNEEILTSTKSQVVEDHHRLEVSCK